MPVEDAIRDFLIDHAKEDFSKLSEEELEIRRKQLENGLQNVLKPYLSRKEFGKIEDVLQEMMSKVDSSVYDKRYVEKVKITLKRVLNWCRAWERLKS